VLHMESCGITSSLLWQSMQLLEGAQEDVSGPRLKQLQELHLPKNAGLTLQGVARVLHDLTTKGRPLCSITLGDCGLELMGTASIPDKFEIRFVESLERSHSCFWEMVGKHTMSHMPELTLRTWTSAATTPSFRCSTSCTTKAS